MGIGVRIPTCALITIYKILYMVFLFIKMGLDKIKIGDLVVCRYDHNIGVAYGKVLKIFDINNGIEVEGYVPVITGWGDKNSKLEITLKIVGYDLREDGMEHSLSEIVELDDTRVFDPHHIFRVINEEDINRIKEEWELLMREKLSFLYKNVNRPPIGGRKILPTLKF